MQKPHVCVYMGEELAKYGFGNGHPFSPQRLSAFWDEVQRRELDRLARILTPKKTVQEKLEYFHDHDYVEKVKTLSRTGQGYLDNGDTPAFLGVYEAGCYVVGTALDALHMVMTGNYRRAFTPIGGLHHAGRDGAAGFCVFNDCGVVIEALRKDYQVSKILYVDIDAHHGDGVFYAFEDDPDLYIVDIHEDGRFLYPGTGRETEIGKESAKGSKLNLCLQPGADDEAFAQMWIQAEAFIKQLEPQIILLQCGADCMADDPITHLKLSEKSFATVATTLCRMAETYCGGRIIGFGGGGYNLENLAKAWCQVVQSFVEAPFRKTDRD